MESSLCCNAVFGLPPVYQGYRGGSALTAVVVVVVMVVLMTLLAGSCGDVDSGGVDVDGGMVSVLFVVSIVLAVFVVDLLDERGWVRRA